MSLISLGSIIDGWIIGYNIDLSLDGNYITAAI